MTNKYTILSVNLGTHYTNRQKLHTTQRHLHYNTIHYLWVILIKYRYVKYEY